MSAEAAAEETVEESDEAAEETVQESDEAAAKIEMDSCCGGRPSRHHVDLETMVALAPSNLESRCISWAIE